MSKTYEELAAENYPKELLPLDEGRHCPPFEATLYRLALALLDKTPLTAELKNLNGHRLKCSACETAVKRYMACIDSTRRSDELQNAFISELDFAPPVPPNPKKRKTDSSAKPSGTNLPSGLNPKTVAARRRSPPEEV
jgi:hypothetical protein